MFPGSFFYTISEHQMRMSRQLVQRFILFANCVRFLKECVRKRCYQPANYHYQDLESITIRHIQSTINMYDMFEETLTVKKKQILNHHREILRIINEQIRQKSLSTIMTDPRKFKNISEQQQQIYKEQLHRIENHLVSMFTLLQAFKPPTNKFDLLKYHYNGEKMYEIRFGYQNWNVFYEYDINYVKTEDSCVLETAIIKKRKNLRKDSQQNLVDSDKCVLFCNPNGVYIQYFAIENQYIKNYLNLGYKIILWNFRGYAQSTGVPTITKSQQDAELVYRYYTEKGFQINIVHGYSIGGSSAIGLAYNHQKKHLSTPQVLIIDRSFSSIGQMSIQFGDVLHNLTKIIFYKENMDLSHLFEKLNCKKMLIWDNMDEVIPDRASVKAKILHRTYNKSKRNKKELQEEEESEEQEQMLRIDEVQKMLAETVRNIVTVMNVRAANTQEQRIDSSQRDTGIELKEEIMTNSSESIAGENQLRELVQKIRKVDGGGIDLFADMHQLMHLIADKPSVYDHKVRSYILGMVVYGSFYPLQPNIHDHALLKNKHYKKQQPFLKKSHKNSTSKNSKRKPTQNNKKD